MSYTPQWVIDRFAVVAAFHGVSYGEVCSKGRMPEVVRVREIGVVCCRDYKGPGGIRASYPSIVAGMGRNYKAHTTAMTAYDRAHANPERMADVLRTAGALGLVPFDMRASA